MEVQNAIPTDKWRLMQEPCVIMLLVLSHSQAAVERGFSINKQAEEVYLQVETFVAKRIIRNHVTLTRLM